MEIIKKMEILNDNNKKWKKKSYEKPKKKNQYKNRSKSKEILPNIKTKVFNRLKLETYLKLNKTKDDNCGKEKIKKIKLSNDNEKDEIIEYIEKGELGKRAFGTCYIYESTKDWNQYAAKIVSKDKLKGKNRQSILTEINIQKSLKSPKIVKVKSYSEDDKNIYIILELCKNRSLYDLLKRRKYLSEFEVRNYMFQLIQGVKYLHKKMIIHRDLKPSNILLDEKLELKISDFGLITKLNNIKDRKRTNCGTLFFKAPEVINPGEKGYSFEVDIWSIGVIMYNLLTGKYPFYDKSLDNSKIQNKILNDQVTFPNNDDSYNPKISEIAKDLILQILVKDPKKRPGLNQILYHDFFHIQAFPRFLNISTLQEQSDLKEAKKDFNETDEDIIINKEPKMKNLYQIIVNDIPEIKYEDLYKYTLEYNSPNINKIDYWITFFHISSYGFCYYEVNNGMFGIMWKKNENDKNYEGDRFLFNLKDEVFYKILEGNDEDIIKTYKINDYPNDLKEKMEIIFKYHNEIKQKTFNHENQTMSFSNENCSLVMIVYIKSFHNDENGKFLLLSDDTKQIIFKDEIVILISDKKETLGYIDRQKKISFIPLINAMENSNKDLISRLKYIKKVNNKDIKNKMQKKLNKSQDEQNQYNEKVEE